MLTAVTSDALVSKRRPSRRIESMVDKALSELSPNFDRMQSDNGRAPIPPVHSLKSGLLLAWFY